MKTVWLSCEGETPVDVENVGAIQYFPQSGFPGYYFPYNNTENYMSPMVAIYFERPQSKFFFVCYETLIPNFTLLSVHRSFEGRDKVIIILFLS
jgi:hypothetical protein